MYKRLRFYIRYSNAFVKRHYLPLIGGIVFAILSFFLLPKLIVSIPQFRSSVHIGIIGRYTISDLPLTVQNKLGIGLTVVGSDWQISPGLAKSWQISEDGKTITFELNPDIYWQDGTKIHSADIKYQFKDARIEYPSDSQIVFHLQDPYSPLPALVSRPLFKSGNNIFKRAKIVSTGSYTVKNYKQNGKILETLTLSPIDRQSHLPLIVYHFYASPQSARTAFKLGLLREVNDLPDLGDLSTWSNIQTTTVFQKDRYVAVFFNTDDPVFTGVSGKNLRLALSYATTKPTEGRATSPIPDVSWAFYSDTKKYPQDLPRSQQLLKSVEKVPQKITLKTLPAYVSVAENIKADWEKLGIEVEIISQPDLVNNFQVSLLALAVPIDPDQYLYWHSTQETTNLTRLKNPRIDKLLEDGRKTWDFETRKKIYQDFQKYLVEEAPAIFLSHPQVYTVSKI